MDIKGKSIQKGIPTPENPVEIESMEIEENTSDKIPFMLMEQICINEQLKEELDKKDKIINELKEKIEYLEKEDKVVRIFKENMPEDTEIVVITKENYEKNFKKED